ncbi:MAG: PKD domain-containing protein [Proteobacteria bacterium]|nr:PKD domain-containing protein [Pseudomonadota bacterium]
MLLLFAAACTTQAPDSATKAPCAVDAAIELDRASGVVPLPVSLRGSAECLDAEPTWDLGDGTTATGWDVEHTYLGSGTFTITMRVGRVERRVEVLAAPPECPELLDVQQVGELGHDELDEASGLSHSPTGVLWTHNDSGDGPRLFAMSTSGEHLGTVTLSGAPDGDWEDSTRLVDAETGDVTLFIGDIGDNAADREAVVVYALAEPVPLGDTTVEDWAAIELSYPDGPRNADTLMVDPIDGALLIVTDGGSVYRKAAPHEDGTRTVMEHLATLPLDVPTGGEISPLGDRLAVRTGTEAFVWPVDRSVPLGTSLAEAGCELAIPDEIRGEALAFDASGAGYFTVSEELHQPIWYTGIVPIEQPCDGLQAHIIRSADGELPLTVAFAVDPACVPAGIASVEWDLGDEVVVGEEIESTWLASGEYPIAVTVTDTDGAVAYDSTTVVVSQQTCPDVSDVEVLGEVGASQVVEASGLAHSREVPGVLWTHNDSGGVGDLFALSEEGELLETVEIDINSGDWEDLAYGWTDAGGWTLFVGDVGDNAEAREDITIYLVPETDPNAYGEMTLTYEDGEPHNCESIAIDPQTGELVVITKSYSGDTQVYVKSAPHLDGDVVELSLIAELDTAEDPFSGSAATTAADFSPHGNLLAVRTYTDVWLFRRDASETLAESFDREPCDGDAPSEQQGESIAFATDGSGYFLLSEGEDQPLNFVGLD